MDVEVPVEVGMEVVAEEELKLIVEKGMRAVVEVKDEAKLDMEGGMLCRIVSMMIVPDLKDCISGAAHCSHCRIATKEKAAARLRLAVQEPQFRELSICQQPKVRARTKVERRQTEKWRPGKRLRSRWRELDPW